MVKIKRIEHPTSAETPMWGTATGRRAGHQDVNRCHIRGESWEMYLPSVKEAAHSGF